MKSKILIALMLCSFTMVGQGFLNSDPGEVVDWPYLESITFQDSVIFGQSHYEETHTLEYRYPTVVQGQDFRKEHTIEIGEGVILIEDHTGQKRVEVDPKWLAKYYTGKDMMGKIGYSGDAVWYQNGHTVLIPGKIGLTDREREKLMEKEQDKRRDPSKGMGMLEDFER